MQKRTLRRMIAVLDQSAYQPNDSHRETVVLLKLNGVTHERIATCLGIGVPTMEYWYAKELDLGVDALMAHAAKRMVWLANQNTDLGVALRANQAILGPRVKAWRDPTIDPTQYIGDISDLGLEQCEAAIASLERQRRAAATSQDSTARADPDQEKSA